MSQFISKSFTQEQLAGALEFAGQIVTEVGPELREHFGKTSYDTKNDDPSNLVTYWDYWAQEQLIAGLSTFDQSIGVVAEEGINDRRSVYWAIDPIDGTNHFIRGTEFCTSMVALVDNDVPVAGIIYDFVKGHIYSAALGCGAKQNDSKIRVSKRPVDQAYVALYCDENNPRETQIRQKIAKSGGSIVQFCATGFTMFSIAKGAFEGLVSVEDSYGTTWDTAAGAILIHEAGGSVTNLANPNSPYRLAPTDFCVSNERAHNDLLACTEG